MATKKTQKKKQPMDDLFGGKKPAAKAKTKTKAKTQAKPKAKAKTKAKSASAKSAKPTKSTKSAKGATAPAGGAYSAKDIEVLEGLEPVRLRPGMYIGGTDEHALHHLVAEVLDNAMDEAVAGHAGLIEIELAADHTVTVTDNGRGIPVDPHPKFKDKSALEVILTTLHSGGKFSGKAYETSGGLHGVGVSVVNALSDHMRVEVARDKHLWSQTFSRGVPQGALKDEGKINNRRGTKVSFHPDPDIFGSRAHFDPERLYRMARSKAYLFRGVKIRWLCDKELLKGKTKTPQDATLHFPGGLQEYVASTLENRRTFNGRPFADHTDSKSAGGKVEWAVSWPVDEDGYFNSYCNTVSTPLGGTHESGFRTAMLRGMKAYAEHANIKQASKIMAEDVVGGACVMLSVFIPEPQFQGQTKEKLVSADATRLVENAVRDRFEHWLSADPQGARALVDAAIARAEHRMRKRNEQQTKRQSATRRLRLPGKLADCSNTSREGTELFIVEGDSAGGSAKQARHRATQAILPLRGKILNVASATTEKLQANQELSDMIEALGCGYGKNYNAEGLRYEKIIIMTDADVDGAHIASLLMTFFYREMPQLITDGHLYIALPPLYRIAQGGKVMYARDDAHRDELMKSEFSGRGKVETSRFKGLGEMPPAQLKETTMNPATRSLLRVTIPHGHGEDDKYDVRETEQLVESLMGKKAELRYAYITEHAQFVENIDV